MTVPANVQGPNSARTSDNAVNSSPNGQNGPHLADNIFKCIFMKENYDFFISISLKFVHMGPIDNKSALIQVMARRRTGAETLPESMLAQFIDAYLSH